MSKRAHCPTAIPGLGPNPSMIDDSLVDFVGVKRAVELS